MSATVLMTCNNTDLCNYLISLQFDTRYMHNVFVNLYSSLQARAACGRASKTSKATKLNTAVGSPHCDQKSSAMALSSALCSPVKVPGCQKSQGLMLRTFQ